MACLLSTGNEVSSGKSASFPISHKSAERSCRLLIHVITLSIRGECPRLDIGEEAFLHTQKQFSLYPICTKQEIINQTRRTYFIVSWSTCGLMKAKLVGLMASRNRRRQHQGLCESPLYFRQSACHLPGWQRRFPAPGLCSLLPRSTSLCLDCSSCQIKRW